MRLPPTDPGLVSAGSWTNVAGVIDTTSSVMEVVVNGRMVSSQATNGPLLTNTTPLTIGASDVGNNFFIGLIDEVQIYNVALPSTAIASLLGGPSIGPATDQRGAARVARAHIDIGATEFQSDLSISGSAPSSVGTNKLLTYTLTLTNNGPDAVMGTSLTDVLPSGLTFQSLSAPAGWTLSTPAIGTSGTIKAVDTAQLAADATANFSLVVRTSNTTPGFVITNSASVVAGDLRPDHEQ